MGLFSRKLCRFLLMFSTCFTSLSVLFSFLYWLPSSSLHMVFDSISSNINEVLLINPSANVFVFGDFKVHHKDWLTYSGGTDRSGELCYNFSQMTLPRWLTFLLGFQTVILIVLLFWIYFFLLMLVFVLRYGFPSIWKLWLHCCLSLHWLSIKFTTACLVSSHSLWLFLCWLGWSSW